MITQGSLVRNQPDPPSHMSPIDGCKEVDEWQSNACRGSFGIEATHPTSFWFWGCSSAGRAAALQAVGSGFESCHLHQSFKKVSKLKRSKQDIEARYRSKISKQDIETTTYRTSKAPWKKAKSMFNIQAALVKGNLDVGQDYLICKQLCWGRP